MIYYINIGSNLGNKEQNIATALQLLQQRVGAIVKKSPTYQSKSWGYVSHHEFANIAVSVETDAAPLAVLGILKKIEADMLSACHRDDKGDYADRIIDLDIMAIDDMVIDLPTLQVPHKHLAFRDFFLVPFEHICPTWQHPTLHKSLHELISGIIQ